VQCITCQCCHPIHDAVERWEEKREREKEKEIERERERQDVQFPTRSVRLQIMVLSAARPRARTDQSKAPSERSAEYCVTARRPFFKHNPDFVIFIYVSNA
jgi:hypothetical protein